MSTPKLHYGPYTAPPLRIGDRVDALIYRRATNTAETRKVRIDALTTAPIPWPMGHPGQPGGPPSVLLCGDLIRAVGKESVAAICHWWGVSRWTVQRWRVALDVPRDNDGSLLQRSAGRTKKK